MSSIPDPILPHTLYTFLVQNRELYMQNIFLQPLNSYLCLALIFLPLFYVWCLYCSFHFTNVQIWSKHFLKFFSHWGNNSFHVLKGSLPIPRQVDLSLSPTLKTEQRVFNSWRTPQLMTSFSYCFLLLNLNPDPVFDLLFEHDLLILTLNSLKWNSI